MAREGGRWRAVSANGSPSPSPSRTAVTAPVLRWCACELLPFSMRASEVEINRTKERAKEQCILKIALVQWGRNQVEFGNKNIYLIIKLNLL